MAKKEAPSRARLSILVAIALGLAVLVFARWWPTKTPQAAQPFASFAGRVVDTNGRPQANLTVDFECLGERPEHATQFDWNPSATTLADGTFRIRLPRTRVSASVRTRPLAHDAAVQFDLTAGSTQQLELQVVPSTSWPPIRGIVVDAGGRAIAGAAIGTYADFHVEPVATTDADGGFTVERAVDDLDLQANTSAPAAFQVGAPAPTVQPLVAAAGRAESWVDLRVSHADHDDAQVWTQWGNRDLRIELRPRLPIEVRVVDANGEPFPVAAVELRGSRSEPWSEEDAGTLVADGMVWRGRARRGASGLSVRLLPKDGAEWFEPPPQNVTAADPGPLVVDLRVRRAATRRIRVADATGQPIEGADVECIDPRGATMTVASHLAELDGPHADGPIVLARATTPQSGQVDLRGPFGQPLQVRVRAKNFAATLLDAIDLGAAEPLVVRLQAAAHVSGQVRMAATAPPGAWKAILRRPSGYPLRGTPSPAAVAADGTFEFADVPPGPWIVQLDGESSDAGTVVEGNVAEVTLGHGENRVAIDVSSWRWTEVRARVRIDGSPAANASVWLERAEPERIGVLRSLAHVELDAAGEFQGTLRPGRYRLGIAEPPRAARFGTTVEIPDEARAGSVVDWDVHTGELELHLVDARGTPARRILLLLLDDMLDFLVVPDQADGEGILRARVPAGEWRLAWVDHDPALSWAGEAFVERYLASRRPLATLTVRAGETTQQRVEIPDAALDRR